MQHQKTFLIKSISSRWAVAFLHYKEDVCGTKNICGADKSCERLYRYSMFFLYHTQLQKKLIEKKRKPAIRPRFCRFYLANISNIINSKNALIEKEVPSDSLQLFLSWCQVLERFLNARPSIADLIAVDNTCSLKLWLIGRFGRHPKHSKRFAYT